MSVNSRPTIMRMTFSSLRLATTSVPTSSPSRRTVTRSAMTKISSRRWEMNTTETPCSLRVRICWKSVSTSRSVSDEVGSSMTIRRASRESALATSTICCCASGRKRTSVRGSIARFRRPSCSRAWAYSRRQSIVPGTAPAGSRPR